MTQSDDSQSGKQAGLDCYLVQSHDSPLKDGQGLRVDGLSMVGPAGQDVPPPPVSLSQGDTQRVWQEEQSQKETNHIEGGCSPELVPAKCKRCQQIVEAGFVMSVHVQAEA